MLRRTVFTLFFLILLFPATGVSQGPATLKLTAPLDYQVVQRSSRETGNLSIAGEFDEDVSGSISLQFRFLGKGGNENWQDLNAIFSGKRFSVEQEIPAGGWYRLEVSAVREGRSFAEAAVEHFGIGEVFVVAGQSNSANFGEEKQRTTTERLATFDRAKWTISHDPQPGAGGKKGSFLPVFGDAMVQRFDVPIGFVSCGIGATSVRQWLPKGARFSNPPTLKGAVVQLPSGEWESTGKPFQGFVNRMKQLGPNGFRAVLWHQGESDANQRDPLNTLPGPLYREYLERMILASQKEIGWQAPWFVAQVSYHVPGDEFSPDIRAAQASLWKDGIALEGPDSDAMKGKFRESNGNGVHFSAAGLREHGTRWVEKVAPWLEEQLKVPAPKK